MTQPALSQSAMRQAMAFTHLQPVFHESNLRVLARHPNGVVELCFEGQDGSRVDLSLLLPPQGAIRRKLIVKEIAGWHAPTGTRIGDIDEPDIRWKMTFLLLTMVNVLRDAVMEALGPAARGAEWWTDCR